ncbi:MAG: hypothetical protein ACR2P3_12785 [Geminicoccaceae bacterium]
MKKTLEKKPFGTTAKVLSALLLATVVSACGTTGSPQQLAQAAAVHAFDENRAPFGQRIVLASARYKPRVYGLNPYFGR